jgi:cytochrome c553
MGTILRLSLILCVTTTVLVGVAVPLIVTGIARVLFADAFDDDRGLMAAAATDVAARAGDDDAARSEAQFTAPCSACHQASGEGMTSSARYPCSQ